MSRPMGPPGLGIEPVLGKRQSPEATSRFTSDLIDVIGYPALLGLGAALILLRLIVVTDYAPEAALTFVASVGIVESALGALLPWLPVLLFTAAVLATLQLPRNLNGHAAAAVVWLLLAVTVPWPLLPFRVFDAVAALVAAGAIYLRASGASERSRKALARTVVLASVVSLVLSAGLDRRVWLPTERVVASRGGAPTTESNDADEAGNSAFVGYVLASDERWTTLLLESPRTVLRLPAQDVQSRTVCALDVRRTYAPVLPSLLRARGRSVDEAVYVPACR